MEVSLWVVEEPVSPAELFTSRSVAGAAGTKVPGSPEPTGAE